MTALLTIDDALMRQIEAVARRSRLPAEKVIESALRQYLDAQATQSGAGGGVELPVAQQLADPKVDVSKSLGKLLDDSDDDLPLEKLR